MTLMTGTENKHQNVQINECQHHVLYNSIRKKFLRNQMTDAFFIVDISLPQNGFHSVVKTKSAMA